ncbi:MAG: NAD(P)H-binding protein [Bacteroidia bacterium]
MGKTAIIIGATGLIGNELLNLLLNDSEFEKVKIFVRKSQSITNSKLEQHIVNFDSIENFSSLITGDVCYCCLGTTINTAGSKEAFTKVDYTYPTEFAKIAKNNGIANFLLISSIGANKNSSNFYLKVKGDTEYALEQLNFKHLALLRPSMLLGKRTEFRLGESIGKIAMKLFSFAFIGSLKAYKAIEATTVAKAMIVLSKKMFTNDASKHQIVLSDKIQELGEI